MAKLTKSDVLHVARLAKLELSDKEIVKFTLQLSEIVNFVGELSKVDVKDVVPTSQTTGLINVTREDGVNSEEVLTQEEALSGTDKVHNGYFVVDAILTERTDK